MEKVQAMKWINVYRDVTLEILKGENLECMKMGLIDGIGEEGWCKFMGVLVRIIIILKDSRLNHIVVPLVNALTSYINSIWGMQVLESGGYTESFNLGKIVDTYYEKIMGEADPNPEIDADQKKKDKKCQFQDEINVTVEDHPKEVLALMRFADLINLRRMIRGEKAVETKIIDFTPAKRCTHNADDDPIEEKKREAEEKENHYTEDDYAFEEFGVDEVEFIPPGEIKMANGKENEGSIRKINTTDPIEGLFGTAGEIEMRSRSRDVGVWICSDLIKDDIVPNECSVIRLLDQTYVGRKRRPYELQVVDEKKKKSYKLIKKSYEFWSIEETKQ
jgi:hypothetical protein